MKLKLSDYASLAEVVSAVAVVITLVFLIEGIRDNAEVTRSLAYSYLLENLNQTQRDIYSDPELNDLYSTFLGDDDGELRALGPKQRSRLRFLVTTIFRNYDSAYTSRRYGVIADEEWERFDGVICGFRDRALMAFGVDFANATTMSAAFRDHIESTCSPSEGE